MFTANRTTIHLLLIAALAAQTGCGGGGGNASSPPTSGSDRSAIPVGFKLGPVTPVDRTVILGDSTAIDVTVLTEGVAFDQIRVRLRITRPDGSNVVQDSDPGLSSHVAGNRHRVNLLAVQGFESGAVLTMVGTYQIQVTLDPDATLPDDDRSDNQATIAIEVIPAGINN